MRFWNYGAVAGIGVLINYTVWVAYVNLLPWFMVNAMAILAAWLWNWSMSVGPFGYLWGFSEKLVEKPKNSKKAANQVD